MQGKLSEGFTRLVCCDRVGEAGFGSGEWGNESGKLKQKRGELGKVIGLIRGAILFKFSGRVTSERFDVQPLSWFYEGRRDFLICSIRIFDSHPWEKFPYFT